MSKKKKNKKTKEKMSGIKLMTRPEKGLPFAEWDYLWATAEEVEENRKNGYVFMSEVE